MDRVYQANAIETPPSTTASSGSYPTAGDKASGQLATVPGPYWFYSITEEIRNALIAAGVTPDAAKVNQLAEAMSKFLPLSGGTVTGAIRFNDGNAIYRTKDSSGINVFGGTGANNGAYLQAFGKDSSGNEGVFNLVASNGTDAYALRGNPNGTLTWAGLSVERVNTIGTMWIRYENGLQMCWAYLSTQASNGGVNWSFPAPFSDTNITVTGNVVGSSYNNWSVTINSISNSNVNVWVKVDGKLPSGSQSVLVFAIGRWI